MKIFNFLYVLFGFWPLEVAAGFPPITTQSNQIENNYVLRKHPCGAKEGSFQQVDK